MSMKLVLFGAGDMARNILSANSIKPGTIAYICDSDSAKWNTRVCVGEHNLTVYPPEKLAKEDPDSVFVLITAAAAAAGIFYQVGNMGIRNCCPYVRVPWTSDFFVKFTHVDSVRTVRNLLEDDRSKYIYDKVISKKLAGDIDFFDICEPNQYFLKDIFPVYPDEIFLDCGVLEGDTIEGFIDYAGGVYKRIYAFEPNKKCCEVVRNKFQSEKITLFDKAVYDEVTELCFDGHQINPSGDNIIETIRIDDVIGEEAVTFVKMDVEGAEMAALHGAKNTIIRNKPKLAVCIYHKFEDLWEIPLLLNEWVPEYKFYVRHHCHVFYETVLYAVVK